MMAAPRTGFSPRELALASLFGAGGLLLPIVFHIVLLGGVFMPMYLPLVTLAFLVRPSVSVSTALVVPLLSAFATGMPPLYPPVVLIMIIELGCMALFISSMRTRFTNPWFVLIPALALGRVVNAASSFGAAWALHLPVRFFTLATFVSSWPGLVLLVAVVPPLVRVLQPRLVLHPTREQERP